MRIYLLIPGVSWPGNSALKKQVEAQNHIGWKRPLRSIPAVKLTLSRLPSNHMSKHHIFTSSKYLKAGEPHSQATFSSAPYPFCEETFPNTQSKVHLCNVRPLPLLLFLSSIRGEASNDTVNTFSDTAY